MADARLNSMHFGFDPRRTEYRRARDALLQARDWVTFAAEKALGLADQADDWPEQVLPGTKYLLIDSEGGLVHSLRTGLNTIGRMPNNDVVLEESTVSRRHCVILVQAWGACELHDTASRNGTYVNDRRVSKPVRVSSGDRIRICDRVLLFAAEKECVEGPDDHPATVVE